MLDATVSTTYPEAMTPSDRILTAAVEIAATRGWRSLTRDAVAGATGLAQGTINLRWGTVDRLRAAVMRDAVARGLLDVVAAGLGEQHPDALAAPLEMRRAALERLL